MFAYGFMRNAFLASTFIAITCGAVGVYVVARNFSFFSSYFVRNWLCWCRFCGLVRNCSSVGDADLHTVGLN